MADFEHLSEEGAQLAACGDGERLRRLCHIAVRRVAKILASRNNQTGATAVRHVSIAAARST
jgi:hypothetical protein